MEDCEGTDTYVIKLREVFNSCDTTGSGCLNKEELLILCEQLHLDEHSDTLAHCLLENECEVKFDDFKECFVAVLTQSIPDQSTPETNNGEGDEDLSDDREVSPKFTLGRKQYGRRSRPASIIDNDDSSIISPSMSGQNSFVCSFGEKDSEVNSTVENNAGKRPMSPNTFQQPPAKSGRTKSTQRTAIHGSPERHLDFDNDSCHSFDSNPIQYLHETWKKLNIGQNGYLNVEELSLVCEHIGMDMTEEVVAQLFEKLDCDQDGQISFEEFLQGLFQHGDTQINCDSPVTNTESSKNLYKEGSRDDQIANSSLSGIFSCIDLDNSGFAEAASVLELWESLAGSPPRELQALNIKLGTKVNLSDLTADLEQRLTDAVAKNPLLEFAFYSHLNELQYLRQVAEQMQNERSRLRLNIEEANARAALLAQEVDENHTRLESSLENKLLSMEKKYQEQIRDLLEELQQERDSLNSQTTQLKLQLQENNDSVREEEAKLKALLALLQQDNQRLEQELHETSEKYTESKKLNEMFQKELSVMPDLKKRLAVLESHLGDMHEQNYQTVRIELEQQKKINQDLQDKVDELTLQIHNVHQNTVMETPASKNISRNHSWRADYKKSIVAGNKRRGSESSSEDLSDSESPTNGKWRKTYPSNGKQFSEPEALPQQAEKRKKLFSVSAVDTLLRDMMLDQSTLHRKLQVSEGKRLKVEKALKMAEHKNKFLTNILFRTMNS